MTNVKDGVIGHAIGDAFGVPLEFISREKLLKNPVTKMLGNGSHPVPVGFWSDDTSMEIALMASFIEKKKFDYDDIMQRFIDWINKGDYTPGGKLFDIGRTCLKAIHNYSLGNTKALESGLLNINANGNGSLMRILPVAYYCFYHNSSSNEIYTLTKNVSSLTHRHEISIMACYIYVNYVIYLLQGLDKYEAYNKIKTLDYSLFSKETITIYDRILKQDISTLDIAEISSSGYVVDTLEASLWVILNARNFKEAIIGSINLGNDTDTIGAITGSMAGIIYGYDSIPKKWLEKLARREYLENLCVKFEMAIKDNE